MQWSGFSFLKRTWYFGLLWLCYSRPNRIGLGFSNLFLGDRVRNYPTLRTLVFCWYDSP